MLRLNPDSIRNLKGKRKLVCLTAYTAPIAGLLAPHVDLLLVGDSVGMVLHGMDNTLGVSMDMMIMHGSAVMRGLRNAGQDCFVVVDLPYGSYEASADQALASAKRLIEETGAHAVKLEGGLEMVAAVRAITAAGIAVMGHIGLQPQSVEKEGGYKIKGRGRDESDRLVMAAKALEEAGCFSMVVEGTIPDAAALITGAVDVPVIGIGASKECDGQILVTDDMVGMHAGRVPKFVLQYAQVHGDVTAAVEKYAADVQSGAFPSDAHVYSSKKSA